MDPSDRHAARVVTQDAALHQANRAAHRLARAVPEWLELEEAADVDWMDEEKVDNAFAAKSEVRKLADEYERAIKAVATDAG